MSIPLSIPPSIPLFIPLFRPHRVNRINLDGNQDIYVIPAAGGEPRRVTRDPGGDFQPEFSPDASEVVFHSTRNGTRDIYLINADGTAEQRLTSDSVDSRNPSFSPDGLRIAYWRRMSGRGEIRVLRRDRIGGPWRDARAVTIDGTGPKWSPDGAELLVYSQGLKIVTPAGSERRLWDGRLDGRVANIDGLGWMAASTPWDTTKLSDGRHALEVRAVDRAGHVTSIAISVIVDNNSPACRIVSPADGAGLSRQSRNPVWRSTNAAGEGNGGHSLGLKALMLKVQS